MNKEKLIELKKKLESKYVGYDGTGTYTVITQYALEQQKNVQGAVEHLENYFERLITKLELKGKSFDELTIFVYYRLFYKEEYYDRLLDGPTTNVNPLEDLIVVAFGDFCINGDKGYNLEPDDIYEDLEKHCMKEYIVSFDEFKIALENSGFEMKIIKSFDEIKDYIDLCVMPMESFTIKFTKNKRLVKE